MPTSAIHVIAAGERHLPGIVAHLHIVDAPHRTIVDAIPVTTVERTIVDVAATTPRQRLRTMIENGMRQDLIDFATLRDLVHRRAGRPGAPNLESVLSELSDVAPRAHPGLEQPLLELIRAAGLPEPSLNVSVEGFEVDFCWRDRGLIVETDGWAYHRTRRSFEDDRRRDAILQAAGWRVIRVTDERVTREPAAVIAQLTALLSA